MTEEQKQKEIIELIKARLETMPSDAILSMGNDGEFDKKQLIEEVERNTEVGKKVIEIQMRYLELLKKGVFYANTPNYQT